MNDTSQLLAKHAERLSGAQFEEFCCAWLEATKEHKLLGGTLKNIQPYGRPGQGQDGIDILCDVLPDNSAGFEQMTKVVFQCKRVRDWDEKKTQAAINKLTLHADECVLVLATQTDTHIQRVIDETNRKRTPGAPFWYVWFIGDIQRRIETDLKNELGARLLTSFFGTAVSQDLIGLVQASPLMIANARFAGMIGALRHEQPLLGRDTELRQLLDFLHQDGKRALILGSAGGQGKTRLLVEFAKRAADEKPTRCVRWMDECAPETLDEALQWLPRAEQIVLILDDAHRWEKATSGLFKKLIRLGERVKIVIGTRPYREKEIESELIQAGLLARQQVRMKELQPLPRQIQKKMAKAALQPRWQGLVGNLVDASGNSLLILQLGADHLNAATGPVDLHQDTDFRRTVLASLLVEDKIAEDIGHITSKEVGEVLDVLAILSSAPLNKGSQEKLAGMIGISSQQFQRLLNHLRDNGHLEVNQSSNDDHTAYRLIPDLMADYRAVEASFDNDGKAKDLPKRLWELLQEKELIPYMLRNLSEAEYIARLVNPHASKVTGPLMKALQVEYSHAGWQRRLELLGTWKSIAELQPNEALEQVREALCLQSDQPAETPTLIDEMFAGVSVLPSYQSVVQICAKIVEIIGCRHENLNRECLDLLWEMDGGQYGAILEKVGTICSLARYGSVQIAEAGMGWIKAMIMEPASLCTQDRLSSLIHKLLDWCFKLKIHETEWANDKIPDFRVRYRTLAPTRHFREAALEICCCWLRSSIPSARLAAANFFRHFICPNSMPVNSGNGGRAEDRKAWKQEQSVALKELKSIIATSTDVTTLWAIRHMLIEALPYAFHERSGRHPIHDILETYPDSFEMRIHRLFLPTEHSDTWETVQRCAYIARCQSARTKMPDYDYTTINEDIQRGRQVWHNFIKATTAEVLDSVKNLTDLRSFLIKWEARLTLTGALSFWPFIVALKTFRPELLSSLAESILTDSEDALDQLMVHLVGEAEDPNRTEWTLRALKSVRPSLILPALRSLRGRRQIQEEELRSLKQLAGHSDADIREAVLRWAEDARFPHDQAERVFEVLSALKLHLYEKTIADSFSKCLRQWLDAPFPMNGVPHGSAILQLLIPFPDLDQHQFKELVKAWSRHDPAQCVAFLESRIAEWLIRVEKGDQKYRVLPYLLDLHTLEAVPGINDRIKTAFEQLTQTKAKEASAIWRANWFKVLAHGAWSTYMEWLDVHLFELHDQQLLLALEPIDSGTLLPFRQPDMTEKILGHANQELSETRRRIRCCLIGSLHPVIYSYQPRQPHAHDLANREKALELSREHRLRPVLHEFYLSIVQMSGRMIEAAKQEEPW